MRVSERMFFIPPSAGLETQSSQRMDIFSFLLRGQKRKDLPRDGSEDSGSVHKNTLVNEVLCRVRHVVICFPSPQRKTNKKVTSASAVRIVLSKTLLGSPFKPPFLGVVVDWGPRLMVS